MVIGKLDLNTTGKYSRIQERQMNEERRKRHASKEMTQMTSLVILESSSASSSTSDNEDDDKLPKHYEKILKTRKGDEECGTPSPSKRSKQKESGGCLAEALDRTNTSDRKAQLILACSGNEMSRSTIRRKRLKKREETYQKIREDFSKNVKMPLVVHFDGKLMADLDGSEHGKVDRLAILVSGANMEKLLAIPKLASGTGESVAQATAKVLEEWNVTEHLVGMCFDTTSANTGHRSGACILLEGILRKHLLNLSCRHHIMEIILSNVFSHFLGPSTGPDVLVFKRFQKAWDQIDKHNFTTELIHDDSPDVILKWKDESICFAREQLQENHARDDYFELLHLSLLCHGETVEGRTIRRPGAYHQARWMSKLLYCMKMYLFREQLTDEIKLTARETNAIEQISKFGCLLYMKNWFMAPRTIQAAFNDLRFLQDLDQYPNPDISNLASIALKRHLWYLGEELIAFAFFDDRVTLEEKEAMRTALNRAESKNNAIRVNPKDKKLDRKQLKLEDFVSKKTKSTFALLGISVPENDGMREWTATEAYREAKKIIQGIRCVNDTAERGVKLVQDYNRGRTKNEDQFQMLLQTVEKHRNENPLKK